MLKQGSDHAEEFFGVGYKPTDANRLFRDIERGYDLSKKISDSSSNGNGVEKFSIPMKLGVNAKRLFRTVWQKDNDKDDPRLITAYIDRRLEEK